MQISFKTVNFLYRYIHLEVVGIDARIIFAKFPGHRVKGQRSSALTHTKMANKLFTFSTSSKEPLGRFQPNLVTSISI